MRKILVSVAACACLWGGGAMAADMPEVPEVDYDPGGAFYLRGSAALNLHWAREVVHPALPAALATVTFGFG